MKDLKETNEITIYLNCENGISGDMLVGAIRKISGTDIIKVSGEGFPNHGRHLSHVEKIIDNINLEKIELRNTDAKTILNKTFNETEIEKKTKILSKEIYRVLAKAEAFVHNETIESVHFHEVGRDKAISNIVSFAFALATINPKKLYVSEIKDGIGSVICAHGEISVPVPAVKAMMNECDLKFGVKNIEGERVTPTALAMIIGAEGEYIENAPIQAKYVSEVFGDRDEKKEAGLKIYEVKNKK